jgi:capsular exopolysaccharide synthesis family protein
VEGQQRLEAAAESLGQAATLNANMPANSSPAVFRSTMIQMNDQTDAAGAILTWVANSLMALKATETDPTRFGQLAVLEERIRAFQARTAKVSDELELLQDAGGPGYVELIKLQQELQLSLLAPQETGISIVDSAALPPSASRTTFFYKIRIPLGVVAGFLAGSLFVLARDQSDTSVRTLGKLRAQLAATPLGVVPKSAVNHNGNPPMISDQEPSSFSDALQLVAAGLSGPLKNGGRSLLITSAAAKEGKTMLAVNLAQALARQGRRVLLVDADLRKPDVAKVLHLTAEEGLAAALADGRNPLDLVQIKDNFAVLPVGHPPANPIELVFSGAMSNFLKQAEEQYDVVLVDGPPALGTAEIKALAKNVHKAVLVVRSGAYSGDLLKQAQEELQDNGAGLVGTVLNFASAEECSHLKQREYQAQPLTQRDPPNQKRDWLGHKVLKPQTLFSRLLGQ